MDLKNVQVIKKWDYEWHFCIFYKKTEKVIIFKSSSSILCIYPDLKVISILRLSRSKIGQMASPNSH